MNPVHRHLWTQATKALIADAGGLDAASALLAQAGQSLSITQLSRCQTPHAPDLLGREAMLALCEITGSPAFAEMLAAMAGKRLAPARGAEEDSPEAVGAVAALISECAEVTHRAAEALRDGKITPTEGAAVLKALGDLSETMSDVQQAVARLRSG
jgi:hypothetical protein